LTLEIEENANNKHKNVDFVAADFSKLSEVF
jgi:hypothetical protein